MSQFLKAVNGRVHILDRDKQLHKEEDGKLCLDKTEKGLVYLA